MLGRLVKLLCIGALLGSLILGMNVRAEEPDFGVLERLSLPWACGESHRVTWDPESHWTFGNSRGLAFDLSMVEGTTILAPADGTATFKIDEKPYIPNLGNYVDLTIEGGWRIRFAHLRDAQQGERQVRAGEILGYSGATGATAAHLHMELNKPGNGAWQASDKLKLTHLYGLPFEAWYEEATITNHDCPASIILAGPVRAIQAQVVLGESVDLVVPLRNIGSRETALHTVQVAMRDDSGASLSVETQGTWRMRAQGDQEITVRVWPNVAGAWALERVTCIGDNMSRSLPARASWQVDPGSLQLVGVRIPSALAVGERIAFEAWVENTGPEALELAGISAEGTRPDHIAWTASAGRSLSIPSGGVARVTLQSRTLPQHAGSWQVERVAFQVGDQQFRFAEVQESFVVLGPQLVAEGIFASPAQGTLNIFVLVKNQGTDAASPESIEVWGWQPEGERAFSVRTRTKLRLDPGEASLIRLEAPLEGMTGTWRLVEAGYWNQGTFCRMSLPQRPTVLVTASDLAKTTP